MLRECVVLLSISLVCNKVHFSLISLYPPSPLTILRLSSCLSSTISITAKRTHTHNKNNGEQLYSLCIIDTQCLIDKILFSRDAALYSNLFKEHYINRIEHENHCVWCIAISRYSPHVRQIYLSVTCIMTRYVIITEDL